MGLAHTPIDLTQQYKQNIYNIALDVSGWDKVTIQAVGPVAGVTSVYGTLNDGMAQGVLYSNNNYAADRATDWSAIQVVNLATGTAANTISAAGLYSVTINTPYIKLGGGGDIYGLFQFNSKVG